MYYTKYFNREHGLICLLELHVCIFFIEASSFSASHLCNNLLISFFSILQTHCVSACNFFFFQYIERVPKMTDVC